MSQNIPPFKPSEGKREEFRKYLEKNGVLDALTKVLVNLYEETDKPADALEFIRDKLAIQAGLETYKQMSAKVTEGQTRIAELEAELESRKGDDAKPPEDAPAPEAQPEAPAADAPADEQKPPEAAAE